MLSQAPARAPCTEIWSPMLLPWAPLATGRPLGSSLVAAFFCTKVAVVVGRFNCSVLTGLIGTYFPLKVNGAFCHSVSYLNQMPSSTVECSQKVTSCSPGKYKQSPRDVNFGTGFFCLLSMFHIRHYQNLKIDFDG